MKAVTLILVCLALAACGKGNGSNSQAGAAPGPSQPVPAPTPTFTPPPGVTPVSGINCAINDVGANNVLYQVVYSRTMYSDGSLANACQANSGDVRNVNCAYGDPTFLTFELYSFSGGQQPFYFWQVRSFNLTAGSPFCTVF